MKDVNGFRPSKLSEENSKLIVKKENLKLKIYEKGHIDRCKKITYIFKMGYYLRGFLFNELRVIIASPHQRAYAFVMLMIKAKSSWSQNVGYIVFVINSFLAYRHSNSA